MQLYTMIAYHSRWLDRDFQKDQPCEYCEHKYINFKEYPDAPKQRRMIRRACDVDHIEWRWWWWNYDNRMYEPTNLILLCRTCHNLKRWKTMIEVFKKIVLSKLKIKTYEQCLYTNPYIEEKALISEWVPTMKTFQDEQVQTV